MGSHIGKTYARIARTNVLHRAPVDPPWVLLSQAFSVGRDSNLHGRGAVDRSRRRTGGCASHAKSFDGSCTFVSCVVVRSVSQPVMDTLPSRQTADMLSIELDISSMALYVGRFTSHAHRWSLAGGNSAALRLCLRYLETIQGSSGVSIRREIGSISCDRFLSHVVLILLIRFIRYTRISISNSVVLRPDSLLNPSKSLSIRSLDIVAFTQDNCHIHDEARVSGFP